MLVLWKDLTTLHFNISCPRPPQFLNSRPARLESPITSTSFTDVQQKSISCIRNPVGWNVPFMMVTVSRGTNRRVNLKSSPQDVAVHRRQRPCALPTKCVRKSVSVGELVTSMQPTVLRPTQIHYFKEEAVACRRSTKPLHASISSSPGQSNYYVDRRVAPARYRDSVPR